MAKTPLTRTQRLEKMSLQKETTGNFFQSTGGFFAVKTQILSCSWRDTAAECLTCAPLASPSARFRASSLPL